MNYRRKILRMSPTPNGRANAYVCTAHYAGHVEIVPTAPGSETKDFPPIPLQGSLAGVVYDHWDDPQLIEEVKQRMQSVIQDWLKNERTDISDFEALHRNLARLQSLNADQPAKCPKLASSVVGKLVVLEFPFDSDLDSGEYIVVRQSADSLYAVFTADCLSGSEIVRIPLDGLVTLDVYEDDEFIREFIERLDDMTTDDYRPEECDAAETTSRQLKRMLSAKQRTESPLDRLFKATDQFFDRLGMCGSKPSECCEV